MIFIKQYHELLKHILAHGEPQNDRTGVGTISTFGYQTRYDLSKGFPILTTKKVPFGLVVSELLWFLKGDTNLRYLLEHNNHIWDEWGFEKYINSDDYNGPDMTNFGIRATQDEQFNQQYQAELKKYQEQILNNSDFAKKHGDLGNIYGKQWRDFIGVDQIKQLIDQIKNNPASRRHIVSAWNPSEISTMALPPCHTLFQFHVANNKLSCQLYQRSGDAFLGVPFNISSYALLLHLIARECNLEVGEFIHTIGDLHIYNNHLEQVHTLLERTPLELPTLNINSDKSLFDLEPKDIQLENYQHLGVIKAPIAV